MNKQHIEKSLAKLENVFCAHHIVVLSADDEGNNYRESVSDMIKNKHGFCKVLDGDSLDDIKMILDWILEYNGVHRTAPW